MLNTIKIGKFRIGKDNPTFIIAEGGVNHNGKLDLAKKIIDHAVRCGANCVKFQTFKTESLLTQSAPKAKYQLKTTNPKETQYFMLKKLELKNSYYKKILNYCKKKKILFLSTPYNIEDVDFLDRLGISAFKLASMHAAEPSFVRYVASKGKPIILSTGMATLEEINTTLKEVKKTKNKKIILLQCTSNYPSLLQDTNLLAMKTIAKKFNVIVGYSDHTQNNIAAVVSIGLGAKVIEKHFTLNKLMKGPDHTTSANPKEFKNLVRNIRDAEKVLGTHIKKPSKIEKQNALGIKRSIVSKVDIKRKTKIMEKMLTFKRPFTGIKPALIDKVVGCYSKVDLPSNKIIKWSYLTKKK